MVFAILLTAVLSYSRVSSSTVGMSSMPLHTASMYIIEPPVSSAVSSRAFST